MKKAKQRLVEVLILIGLIAITGCGSTWNGWCNDTSDLFDRLSQPDTAEAPE